jgi:hypothetical protein
MSRKVAETNRQNGKTPQSFVQFKTRVSSIELLTATTDGFAALNEMLSI